MSVQTNYLNLDVIRTDGGTQSRAHLNQETINEYADLFRNHEDSLPPIKVYFDGENYWNADGFHRLEAAKQVNMKVIPAIIEQGTRRDAILFSVGANAEHGLRRTEDDKRRAVNTLLTDDEWNNWSDNQIAKKCKVSQPFVSKLRKELANGSTINVDSKRTYERNGKTHTMKTSNIGKSQPIQETQEPDRDPNTKEIFDDKTTEQSQPETAKLLSDIEKLLSFKKEIIENHPDLAEEYFGITTEQSQPTTYNVISKEEKIATLNKRLDICQDEYAQKSIEYITDLEKQLEEANQKIAALTETNKTLNKELASIKIDLVGLENGTLEEVCEEISFLKDRSEKFYKINAALEKTSLRIGLDKCISENQDKSEYFFQRYHNVWKEAVDHGIEANNLKEELDELKQKNVDFIEQVSELIGLNHLNQALANTNHPQPPVTIETVLSHLKEEINRYKSIETFSIHPNKFKKCEFEKNEALELLKEKEEIIKNLEEEINAPIEIRSSNQLEQMLAQIQSIFEIELSKKKEVRFGKEKASILLNSIKETLGAES